MRCEKKIINYVSEILRTKNERRVTIKIGKTAE